MGKKLFIGIQRLWYTNTLTAAPSQSSISTLISSATEVTNVHQGTWGYSQDDPSVTDYINELNGQPYYRDKESNGNKTISFTIGEYDYADKAALQGGEVISTGSSGSETAVGWKASGSLQNIEKAIIAQTKTGKYIIFSNASIVAKVDMQEKNMGLGIVATAIENPNSTTSTPIASEYWLDPAA